MKKLLKKYPQGGKTVKNTVNKVVNKVVKELPKEETVNKWLGYPMDKAVEVTINNNPNEDAIDNFRHPMAGRYTAESIANKFPSWMKYTPIPKVVGFVGANALGIAHELSEPNRDKDYNYWDTFREGAEDVINNAIGAGIGTLPLSDKQKSNALRYLSNNNLIPDGYGKGNMYFKKHPKGGYTGLNPIPPNYNFMRDAAKLKPLTAEQNTKPYVSTALESRTKPPLSDNTARFRARLSNLAGTGGFSAFGDFVKDISGKAPVLLPYTHDEKVQDFKYHKNIGNHLTEDAVGLGATIIGAKALSGAANFAKPYIPQAVSAISPVLGYGSKKIAGKVLGKTFGDKANNFINSFNTLDDSRRSEINSNYNKPLVLQNDSYIKPSYIPQQRNGGYTPQNLKFYHGGILPKYGGGAVVPPTWKNMSTGAKTSAITQGALTTATALGIGEDNTILSSGLEMAGTGASIGANFGSWGAAIGAGAGALIGLGKGYFDEEDRIKQRDAQALVAKREQTTADINGGQNIQINNGMQTNRRDNFGTSPIVTGAHGGTIVNRRFYPTGGMVKQTQDSIYPEQELELQESAMLPNGDNMMVDGASHNEGGVKTNLPEGSRIFSDRLKVGKKTFADLARPIQNKIEKIKEKPDSKVNKNTIQLFEQQLDNIFNAQEELKASKEPKQQQQVPQEQMMQDPAMQEQMMQEQMAQDPAMQEQMMQEQMAQEQMMQQQAPQQGFAYGGWIPKFDVGGIDEYPEDERPLKVGWANNQINPNTLGGKRQLGLLPDENQMRLAQLENNQMQMRPLRPSNNPIKEFTNPSNNPIINPIRSYDKHQESNNWWSKQADERAAQEQLNNTRLNTLRQGQQDYDKAALEMKEMQKLPLPSTPKAGYKEMRTIQPTLKAGTETVSQDAYISAAEAAQRRKDAKTSNWSSGKIGQIGALSSSLLNKYAQERNINSLRRPTNIPGVALSAGARPRYLDYSAQLNRINAETNAANRGINLGSGSYSTQAANLAQTRAAQLRGTGEVIQGEQNANNTLYNTYRGQQAEVYNKQNMINAEINKENLANQYGFDTWRTGQRGKATADMYSTFGNVFNNMTSQQNQLDQATIMKNAFNPQVYANTIEGNAALAAGMTKEQIDQWNKNNPDRQLPKKAFGGTISKYSDGGSVYKQKLQGVLNQPTVDQAAQMDADYASALAARKTQYRSDITGLDYKVLTRGGKDLYAANLWNDTHNTAPNKKQVIATKKAIEGKPTASVKAKEAVLVHNNNVNNIVTSHNPSSLVSNPMSSINFSRDASKIDSQAKNDFTNKVDNTRVMTQTPPPVDLLQTKLMNRSINTPITKDVQPVTPDWINKATKNVPKFNNESPFDSSQRVLQENRDKEIKHEKGFQDFLKRNTNKNKTQLPFDTKKVAQTQGLIEQTPSDNTTTNLPKIGKTQETVQKKEITQEVDNRFSIALEKDRKKGQPQFNTAKEKKALYDKLSNDVKGSIYDLQVSGKTEREAILSTATKREDIRRGEMKKSLDKGIDKLKDIYKEVIPTSIRSLTKDILNNNLGTSYEINENSFTKTEQNRIKEIVNKKAALNRKDPKKYSASINSYYDYDTTGNQWSDDKNIRNTLGKFTPKQDKDTLRIKEIYNFNEKELLDTIAMSKSYGSWVNDWKKKGYSSALSYARSMGSTFGSPVGSKGTKVDIKLYNPQKTLKKKK